MMWERVNSIREGVTHGNGDALIEVSQLLA